MSEPPVPYHGDLQEMDGQLKWWNGEKWLTVHQHFDVQHHVNTLYDKIAQLEARLDKQEEYQQEQNH